jgi:hypothetical protein
MNKFKITKAYENTYVRKSEIVGHYSSASQHFFTIPKTEEKIKSAVLKDSTAREKKLYNLYMS